jgi:NAD(P)-dependent dehydrogenase (short-subunit alcohol dehydrogenase family)
VLLDGKTLLISGGASGLGAATAEMIVRAGGSAAILDLNAEAGNRLATSLGPQARFFQADATNSEQVEAAVAEACSAFGAIHGAVCTAGVAVAERVLPREGVQPLDHFSRVIAINLIGTFNVVRLAASRMAANDPMPSGERGIIVMTASVAAFDGQIGQAAYSASKGGIVSMTLPLAREFARIGVRVMTIAPGTFDTPLLAGLPAAARESLAQQVPFPSRLGQPAEFAALVRHVIENEMLNGETIRLDGAIRMAPK